MPAIPGPERPADPDPDHPLGDDDRALWDLLGRASRPPGPGAFFTRRTLRAVANFEEERAVPAWRRRLAELFATRPWVAWSGVSCVGAAVVAALTLGGFGVRSGGPAAVAAASGGRGPEPSAEVLVAGKTPVAEEDPAGAATAAAAAVGSPGGAVRESDVGVIVDLDDLTDSNENRVWQDEDDESAS